MTPLVSFLAFLLTVFSLFVTVTAFIEFDASRAPLGGQLFKLESRNLLQRQSNDLGADCGGDPDCITTDFACGCGFADDSWIDDLSVGGISGTNSTPSSTVSPSSIASSVSTSTSLTTNAATSPQPTPTPPPPSSSPPSSSPPLPPSPTVAPADPPAAPSCVPNPTKKVKDSHEGELRLATKFFCSNYASNTLTTSNVNIAQTIISGLVFDELGSTDIAREYTGSQNEDDVYDISVKSVDGCTPNGGYNLGTPVSGNLCPDILHNAWKHCNNKGRGGSIVAGCLIYSITTRY